MCKVESELFIETNSVDSSTCIYSIKAVDPCDSAQINLADCLSMKRVMKVGSVIREFQENWRVEYIFYAPSDTETKNSCRE